MQIISAQIVFDICELQFDIGRPPMIALARARGALHFTEKRVHFLGPEAPA